MKKILFSLAAAAAACLSGCVSLSDPNTLTSLPGVALVSVTSNSEISWAEDAEEDKESSGLLKGVMNKLSNDGKKANEQTSALLSRADILIEEAGAALEKRMAGSSALKTIPADEVLKSKSYEVAKEGAFTGMAVLKPQGYKFVKMSDKLFLSGLKSELGAAAAIFADFKFEKTMMSGIGRSGAMTANVTLTVTAVNAEGKVIFQDIYDSIGETDIPVVAGVYDPLVLNEDLKIATTKVCSKFLEALE